VSRTWLGQAAIVGVTGVREQEFETSDGDEPAFDVAGVSGAVLRAKGVASCPFLRR
jgi:hypothetical protein